MAEVYCHACGNLNPDELEVCQFCQARLKPWTAPLGRIASDESKTGKTPDELKRTLPTWLRGVPQHDQSGEQPIAESGLLSPESPKVAKSTGGSSDWMAGLETKKKEEDDQVTDWLTDFRKDTAQAISSPASTPEPKDIRGSEDWLKNLQEESGTTTDKQITATSRPFNGKTGELREGLPDWLSDFLKESTKEPPSPVAGDLSDYQADEATKRAPVEYTAPTEDVAEPATSFGDEFPGWRAEFPNEQISDGTFEEESVHIESAEPAWLSGEDDEQVESIPPAERFSESATDIKTSFPDGLSDRDGAIPIELSIPSEDKHGSAVFNEEDLSDWLSDIDIETVDLTQDASFEQPVEMLSTEYPEWLSSLGVVEQGFVEPSFKEGDEQSVLTSETPTLSSTPAFIIDNEKFLGGDESEISGEVPDWLISLGSNGLEQEQHPDLTRISVPVEPGESIPPAVLPSSMQDVQPVEADLLWTPISEESDQSIASDGPLGGISGILPSGSGFGPTRKLLASAMKLQVNENQKANVALLETMLASESKPLPLTTSAMTLSLQVLRWIVAIIILSVVGFSVATGSQTTPMPSIYPPQVGAIKDVINDLSSNDPVLLVFDYEPSLAGELEVAASPIVDHLMLQGTRLGILSTSPTGPVLAERFMHKMQSVHGYQRGEQYANLGYLPGGLAGVLDFASKPTRTIRMTVDGGQVWASQSLRGVQSLSDFSALIILTDSAETGQIWIEQAGPYLGNSPLLMVTSAQAEPLIYPYYESAQIKGLIAGLSGGAAYETINGRPNLGRQYWDAFSIGLFTAESMIVMGVLWSLLRTWKVRRMQNKDEM